MNDHEAFASRDRMLWREPDAYGDDDARPATEPDPALDFSLEAMEIGSLRACVKRIGTSQIAKMRLALGLRAWHVDDVAYLRDETRAMRGGVSRALLVAAGILAPKRTSSAMAEGTRREREIFAAWKALVAGGWTRHPFERELDMRTAEWRSPPPREWPRMIDRECPDLDTGGFDGFVRTRRGELVIPDIKCARYKSEYSRSALPVWWDRDEMPWWYADQLDAELAISGAGHALLVVGGGWNRSPDDVRGDGPVRVFYQARDENRIAQVRAIATEAMRRIRALREAAEEGAV